MISPKITPNLTKITPKYFPPKIFSPKFLAPKFLVLNVAEISNRENLKIIKNTFPNKSRNPETLEK